MSTPRIRGFLQAGRQTFPLPFFRSRVFFTGHRFANRGEKPKLTHNFPRPLSCSLNPRTSFCPPFHRLILKYTERRRDFLGMRTPQRLLGLLPTGSSPRDGLALYPLPFFFFPLATPCRTGSWHPVLRRRPLCDPRRCFPFAVHSPQVYGSVTWPLPPASVNPPPVLRSVLFPILLIPESSYSSTPPLDPSRPPQDQE